MGGFGHDHLTTNSLPMLAEAGVDNATTDKITQENPKTLFAGAS